MSELKLQQCRLDGRYDVLDCLGRGSYSEVYMARDAAASGGSPHTVVIKALNTSLQGESDPELERTLIENFRNEAIALDRVRHPNIISRLGHGTAIDLQARTFHYLVLEYLSGGDMQALCRARPLQLEGALFYLEQLCAGLEHAHKNGVIHRDIKPQNLLLTADQHIVKIADFGVAKIEAAEGAITRVGTDVYAAPEHHPLAQTGPLDTASLTHRVALLTPAADVYSLAKTFYMLLAGEAPRRFSRKPITTLPPALARESWAEPMLRVLERATSTNPEKRYQTVGEFWREMKDATLPQTRLLREPTEPNGSPKTDAGGGGATMTPPPPAPTFERPVKKSDDSARHRIVVPFSPHAPAAVARVAKREPPVSKSRRDVAQQATPAPSHPARESHLSPRLRNWLVALFLIVAFAAMLYATHKYVTNLRSGTAASRSVSAGNTSALIGRELVTTIDVNLRDGPSRNTPSIGVAEKGSRVKVLQIIGRWYQVSVLEHGRAKEDPDSADAGWAHSQNLKAL
ncbi:MAG: protein kinase [Acidobacteria bacterium]|nr:protein kinase [Acidobacteriota bacterium]